MLYNMLVVILHLPDARGALKCMKNLLQLLFPRRFSPKEEKPEFEKPIVLEVKILSHSYRCGYRLEGDAQFIVTVEPTDEEMRKRFGQFEIYSETVHHDFKDDEITKLPFTINPHFEPECSDEPILILYT